MLNASNPRNPMSGCRILCGLLLLALRDCHHLLERIPRELQFVRVACSVDFERIAP